MPYRDDSQVCPRCQRALEMSRFATGHDVLGCLDCGGSFIADAALSEIATRLLDDPVVDVPGPARDPTRQRRESNPLSCPVCRAPLIAQTMFGAEVDRCAGHGIWLDLGELQAILTNADASEVRCPRCRVPMSASTEEGARVAACARCGGRWMTHPAARAIVGQAVVATESATTWFASDLCPVCDERLQNVDVGERRLHLCVHHGVFEPPA